MVRQMKLSNAIKKLQTLGFEVKSNDTNQFWVCKNNKTLSFFANGKINSEVEITSINVRRFNDEHDSQSDYSAGIWCDNLAQGLRALNW